MPSSFLRVASVLSFCLMLGSCGGGSSASAGGDASAATVSPASAATAGSTTASASAGTPATGASERASNELPVVIDGGPARSANVPFVSVTVCVPGTADCRTIDHVVLDTGSVGLRILADALPPELALPAMRDTDGRALAECAGFNDGYTWGTLHRADVGLAERRARGLTVQVVADLAAPAAPADCTARGPSMGSVTAMRGNGILGIGPALTDCGETCERDRANAMYFACAADRCTGVTAAAGGQVANPIAALDADNNGAILRLPAPAGDGAPTLNGTLVLGIGTAANNGSTATTLVAIDAATGGFDLVLDGRTLRGTIVDSGSNGLFFFDATMPTCAPGWYCPRAAVQRQASLRASDGSTTRFTLAVADPATPFADGDWAVPDLASPAFAGSRAILGLPFFFGRSVAIALAGRSTDRGTGPYLAF